METTEKAYSVNKILDLRGWMCPWVVLKAKSWLSRMNTEEILEVISSDAQIEKSFCHIFERTKDRVIGVTHTEECYHVLVKKG